MTGRGVRGVALASALLVACGTPTDCSAAGCPFGIESGVIVAVPAAVDLDIEAITVCVGDDCDVAVPFPESGVPGFHFVVPGADDGDGVTVRATAPDGRELVGTGPMRSSRPNGDGCPPTCTYAEVSLEPA